jgi:hypothetical protein
MSTPVAAYLDSVRQLRGEDAWKLEITRLTKAALKLRNEKHEAYWRDLTKDYDWLDFEGLKREVAAEAGDTPTMPSAQNLDEMMADAVQKQMPGCRTQAQFNTFRTAFDAFRVTLNAIFEGDKGKEAEGRKLLDLAFTAAAQATDISNKLRDVPEAATSKDAEEFKKPPSEFSEYDTQRRLLAELEGCTSVEQLTTWYESTKPARDSIRSQTLRNILMDTIRSRKLELAEKAG